MSASSSGAFNKFINQLDRSDFDGSENASVQPAIDSQTNLEPMLAAGLAELARFAAAVGSVAPAGSGLSASVAPPNRPDFARTTAEVIALSPRVANPQLVAPASTSTPAPVTPAADPLEGQEFLDDLESWLMQAKRSTRSSSCHSSVDPESDPSR